MYWYVLVVQTKKEKKIEQFLRMQLSECEGVPFIPLQEMYFKKSGTTRKEIAILFPGYVFVESNLSGHQFKKLILSISKGINEMLSVLKYSDSEFAMKDSERERLLGLCNNEHCINMSFGIIKGDKVYIKDGPLKGLESIVRKINRHKRQAWIEIDIMGDLRLVCVGLELVEVC